jgi:DNA polymerase I
VSRLKKPAQELAWASIGNVIAAIQICEVYDRSGFIFAREIGLHKDVQELDFLNHHPNTICTRNVSLDVIRCDCHSDRDDVLGLGYDLRERGFLVYILQPIIDARDEIKAAIRREQQRDDPDEDRLAELEGQSGALKWILVACFGYQGFSNAKFGRIECYGMINAYAREILLAAKQRLEVGG